jgi:hypothetical protein
LHQVEQEARTTVTTLLPFLKRHHPAHHETLNSFFTVETVERTNDWKWDEASQEFVTDDDIYLQDINNENGEDAAYFGFDCKDDIHDKILVRTRTQLAANCVPVHS